MRPSTLRELAADQGIRMPDALVGEDRPELRDTVSRGWWRFQRLYDAARRVLCTPAAVHRVVREAAQDEAAAGSGWMELQVDPSGYAGAFGGLVPALEVMLDAARAAESATGVGIGLVVAANRTRHPLDAATLARLATRYAEGGVIGFGLSNDESRGRPEAFEKAFRIAREAGLLAVPHGGELAGPASVARCLDTLGAHRIGHGVRVVECRETLARVADSGVTLEVCPTSNVALGVVPTAADVPLRTLVDAGGPARARRGRDPCCSAAGCWRSTRSPATYTGSTTPGSPTWPARACAPPALRATSRSGCSTASSAGSAEAPATASVPRASVRRASASRVDTVASRWNACRRGRPCSGPCPPHTRWGQPSVARRNS